MKHGKEINLEGILQELEDLTIDCTCIGITNDECDKCFRRKLAKYVLDKIDEVRKERSKEILKRLVGYEFNDDGWSWVVSKEDIAPLAKEFCVEV